MHTEPVDPELLLGEELEKRAAAERVAYYRRRLDRSRVQVARLLDLGCGNGYALAAWSSPGTAVVGVDNSPYRFGRWISERSRHAGHLVMADAERLPFRDGAFTCVVSSGMIEHVGVDESRPPYQVRPRPDRDEKREVVLGEMIRTTEDHGILFLDFPNGAFPIDFWHGDRVGSFRRHPTPDPLLPTYDDIISWTRNKATVRLLPLANRLQYRQVSRWWWGRLLRIPMMAFIHALDALRWIVPNTFIARFYPFLVLAAAPLPLRTADTSWSLRPPPGPVAGSA